VKIRVLVVLAALGAVAAAFFATGLHQELSFSNLKERQAELEALYGRHPAAMLSLFFAGYVALAATSLPGGAAATIAAGAVFGVGVATLVISFASSIGATFAFMLSRYVLRDWVEARFGTRLARIDEGVQRQGALYLFMLRLVPAIPFMLVNAGMGLTRMRTWTYYWVSQLGMLAGTLLFANAGSRLAEMSSPGDVFTPGVVGAFVALGLLPISARKAYQALKGRRLL
jgi:uncharacterized membrane protein YdjX (TVP38/TMEM64 family)